MKKFIFSLLACTACFGARAVESDLPSQVMLTPYIQSDANTPKADKILQDKLDRIVTKYGVSNNGLQTPFIITAHAIELDKETTATAPPMTAVTLSLTLYIGNGEEGTVFSTCNMELKGVGNGTDAATAAAFKKININDPQINAAIAQGRTRIAEYYAEAGPALIRKAEAFAAAAKYADAYDVLLRIPPVCPQYEEAQTMVVKLVQAEFDNKNRDVIARARAAWSASPNETGATQASKILQDVSNPSAAVRTEVTALMKEMSTRLTTVEDAQLAAAAKAEANAHAERMAAIEGATKEAVARAKNQPKVYYHIHWW